VRRRAGRDAGALRQYARGDWVDDQVNAYFSDYDFLVVVATEALAEDLGRWERLTTEARRLTGRALVSLIVHDVRQINQEIRVGQCFFSEIVSQGVWLHDTGRFTLAQPKALTARERRQLAGSAASATGSRARRGSGADAVTTGRSA
jgi:hypothetical protein